MTATSSSSPWSREAAPSVTLPPPPPPTQPARRPPHHPQPQSQQARSRNWAWATLALLIVITVSAGVSAAITYLTLNSSRPPSSSASPPTASPSSSTTAPRFSAGEVANAKSNLCHVFDVSVRGQQGTGGFRVEGNPNVPLLLRALNSASAVQNALTPAVPMNVAEAAQNYIRSTLDVTTAAMGNTPISEVNRLTDVDAEVINSLVDACGLPR
jgi:hypothetical protein